MRGAFQRGGGVVAFLVFAAIAAGPAGCEAPKPPEAPAEPAPGNCCMRRAEAAERVCGPQEGCCRGGLERDECEAKNGLWFHSPEGCRGAC
jgi:hypothetical protein